MSSLSIRYPVAEVSFIQRFGSALQIASVTDPPQLSFAPLECA